MSASGRPRACRSPGRPPGRCRSPHHWSKQSPVSLAIGYEVAVTPLQMALAYAAIANGGELLEPGLVREIRRPDGAVVYRRQRRVVRRVMTADIARQLREMLVETVRQRHRVRGWAALVHRRRQDRHGAADRVWRGLWAQRIQCVVRRSLPRARPPIRDPREARRPVRQLLRRQDRGPGLQGHPGIRTRCPGCVARPDRAGGRPPSAGHRAARRHIAVGRASRRTDRHRGAQRQRRRRVRRRGGEPTVVAIDRPLPAANPVAQSAVVVPDLRGWTLRAAVHALHRAGPARYS